MATRYGMISDLHEDPNVIVPAIEMLKQRGAEKLLVNGDIGGNYGSLENSQRYTGFILNQIGKSGLEAYVQPGSHETVLGYWPGIDFYSKKYPNIIDVTKNQKAEHADHHLVFLPGSDFLCGGEYSIGNNETIPTGRYLVAARRKGLIPVPHDSIPMYVDALNQGLATGGFHNFNMRDLKNLVTSPEKTIVVCHVPRKFDNVEMCVDMAEFGEAFLDFPLNGELVRKNSVFPLPSALKIAEAGYPVAIKKENRGNKDLKNLYEELGITKAVSGHFHESSHRAHDSDGNPVPQNTLTTNLFWNSGHLDNGHTGILTVDGERVSYENMRLDFNKK